MTYTDTFTKLRDQLQSQRQLAHNVDSWLQPRALGFTLPAKASGDERALAELAKTPILSLVVETLAQSMAVGTLTTQSDKGADNPFLRRVWQANGLDRLESSLIRSVLAYSHAYLVVTPAVSGDVPVVRPLSIKKMTATFDNPSAEFADSALEDLGGGRWMLYTSDETVELKESNFGDVTVVSTTPTPLGVTPVVRAFNLMDLDGHCEGEVMRYTTLAQRMNKTILDMLSSQHNAGWRTITATGVEAQYEMEVDEYGEPVTDDWGEPVGGAIDREAWEQQKIELSDDSILASTNPDAKFGSIPATPLEPFVPLVHLTIELIAALSQVPVYALTGQPVNLSADALQAARTPLLQKVEERQRSIGAAYASALRYAAGLAGERDLAEDMTVRLTWRDTEPRSLAQLADAVGKLKGELPRKTMWSWFGYEQVELETMDAQLMEEQANQLPALLQERATWGADTLAEVDEVD